MLLGPTQSPHTCLQVGEGAGDAEGGDLEVEEAGVEGEEEAAVLAQQRAPLGRTRARNRQRVLCVDACMGSEKEPRQNRSTTSGANLLALRTHQALSDKKAGDANCERYRIATRA